MAGPTLILLAKKQEANLAQRVAQRAHPQVEYLELARRTEATILDFDDVDHSRHPFVVAVRRRLGLHWGLAALGMLQRKKFAQLYATGEDVGLPFAIMLKARGDLGRLTMVVHNADTAKRKVAFQLVGHKPFAHLIVLNRAQEAVLSEQCHLPQAKIYRMHNWIDHHFFAPIADAPLGDYALSVGMENRDYPTLQAAAEGLPYKFHVVASGFTPGRGYAVAGGLREQENFTIGSGYSFDELKALYAGARFVVVPVKRVTYAAGITSCTEALAMGKAVIVSDSPGVTDLFADGKTGRVVPVGDVGALREAIRALWDDRAQLASMGAYNRSLVAERYNIDTFVDAVVQLLGFGQARAA